jgi:hypothetical protein
MSGVIKASSPKVYKKEIRDGYSFIDMIQLMSLSFFSTTTLSPLFTDWLAVGCEMPSRFDSSTVLIFNSRAAQ